MHIILFCAAIAIVQIANSEYTIREGMLFNTIAEVEIKKYTFKIVVQLNIDPIIQSYSNLESEFRKLDLKIHETKKLYGGKYNSVERLVQFLMSNLVQYQTEIANFKQIIPHSNQRHTRGICNFCGTAMNWMYGTMDNNDKVAITQSLKELNDRASDDELIIGKSILLQKGLEKNVIENTERIKNVTTMIIDKLQNYTMSNQRYQSDQANEMEKIEINAIFSNMAIELAQALHAARLDLIKFWDAIEMSIRHKLSANLITPDNFMNMLLKVEKNLQSPDKMILPINVDSMNAYYELAAVSSFAEASTVHVVIKIPITSHGAQYKKIKVTPFPVYWPQIAKFVLWKSHEYILLNADSSYYYLPSNKLTCVETRTVTVCETNNLKLQRSVDTCEINMMLKNDSSHCHKQIVLSHVPFFQQIDNDILYSVQSEQSITVVCKHDGISNFHPLTIINSGIIKNVGDCNLQSDKFHFENHHEHTINIKQNVTMSPSVNLDMTAINVTKFVVPEAISFEDIKKEISKYPTVGKIDFDVLLTKVLMKAERNHSINALQNQQLTAGGVIGILILFTICCSAAVYCYKRKMQRRERERSPGVIMNFTSLNQTPNQPTNNTPALTEIA